MTLISIIYLSCFASLSLWFLFKDNNESKGLRNFFGASFLSTLAAYIAWYLLIPSGLGGYFQLALGLVFLLAGGLFMNTFSNNKYLFILLLGGAVAGYWYLYQTPSKEKTAHISSEAKLDPDAELLVEVKNGHQISELDRILKKYDLSYEPAFTVESGDITDLDDYFAVNIPDAQLANKKAIVAELLKSGLVDDVEENEQIQLDPSLTVTALSPNRRNYGVNDPFLDKVWGFEAMNVDKLYKLLQTKNVKPVKRAKIAILDTGIDANHEDLYENYVSTRSEYDSDVQGHGSHCAGIAGAVSNNAKGIASFAPNQSFVQITSIQVFPRSGGTTQRIIINGMILAADKGADVLSMSLGGPSNDQAQRAYREAVRYANKKGAIVVVAAGNENTDARRRAPASVEGVITVAATDEANKKAKFSNDVSNIKWGLAAPGVNVYSTMPGNKYAPMSGTSMATPYVAGLVGLMKSIKPTLSTEEAFKILRDSGISTGSGSSTGKLIQPEAAIKSLLAK